MVKQKFGFLINSIAGDLDKQFSPHPLVSLKSSHKKLRTLIDLGCIFVGHGLKKDFRILSKHYMILLVICD